MKTLLILILFWLSHVTAFSQPVHTLTDSSGEQVSQYALLPDRGYTAEQVRNDSSLHFITGDTIRPLQAGSYWIRLVVANPYYYAIPYKLWVRPYLNNRLHYFNENSQKWEGETAGIMVATNHQRNQGQMTCVLQGQKENVLYVKTDVSQLAKFGYVFKPSIWLEQAGNQDKHEQFIWIALITSLVVLFLFILNNVVIYYNFRDKTILYYLILQFGAIMYILSYRGVFHMLFPGRVFSIAIEPGGRLHEYTINNLFNHVSVLIIIYGFVQLTRSYLSTRKNLPSLDTILKYGLYAYTIVTVSMVFINTVLFYVDDFTLLYDNILVMAITMAIIATGVAGYLKKLPAAGSFLLANILPLVFMLATALYHVFIGFTDGDNLYMADLAVISQAFCFSIALVARIKSIRNELRAKELEAQQLTFDIREIELRHQLMELENQKISTEMLAEKNRNELLHEKLETNQRELASTTLYMVQKNEMLATLKTQIQELNKQYPGQKHPGLRGIESLLQTNLYLDSDWSKFKLHFEQVHPQFFENLQARHPSLTKNEIRLYAYFHINLSTKEIAALLNIDPASVRRAKTRLYKKMAISEGENIVDDKNA
ncbi:MAG: 7TM diverse intracellular signaling domain-containing protein [Bacteroidota bacterium]